MLKSKVQTLLDSKMFSFIPQDLQINNTPSPSHAGPSVQTVEEIAKNRSEDDYCIGFDEHDNDQLWRNLAKWTKHERASSVLAFIWLFL